MAKKNLPDPKDFPTKTRLVSDICFFGFAPALIIITNRDGKHNKLLNPSHFILKRLYIDAQNIIMTFTKILYMYVF